MMCLLGPGTSYLSQAFCEVEGDDISHGLPEQAYGDAGFEARIDHAMRLAEAFERRIRGDGGAFVAVRPRGFTNVCFWWVPQRLRPFDPESATPEQKALLGKVCLLAACSSRTHPECTPLKADADALRRPPIRNGAAARLH
jgi:hypothetical protein